MIYLEESGMAGKDEYLLLEQKIKGLEESICANGDSTSETNGSVIDNLHGVKQTLTSLTSGKDHTRGLWKRLEELNTYLDPELSTRMSLSNDAKADIVLADEEHLKMQAALLEKVKELTPMIDSQHIKVLPALTDRFTPLSTIQIKQQEQAQELSEETKRLLESYNAVITLLSKEFVQWDEVMTRYEVAHKVRKPDNI